MSILKVSIRQIKAARALLGWSQTDLAKRSDVSEPTIMRLEAKDDGGLGGRSDIAAKIVATLESGGVIFVVENGEGPGVRLRKKPDNAADLTRRIDTIEDNLARTEGPSPQTPEGGMRTLERAYKREAVKKLKNRRTTLKTEK